MEETFKVGDLVEIKSWDEMEKEYGKNLYGSIMTKIAFIRSMVHLCGRKAIIFALSNSYGYDVKLEFIEKDIGKTDFLYSADMLIKVPNVAKPQNNKKKNSKSITETIVITTNGHSTIATLLKKGKAVTAKAMCHPTDNFNLGYGALKALGRLFPDSQKEIEREIIAQCGKDLIKDKYEEELSEAAPKLPNNYIMFENEFYCELGLETNLVDCFNRKLRTGDIVEVYNGNTGASYKVPIVKAGDKFVVAGLKLCLWSRGESKLHNYYINKIQDYLSVLNGSVVNGYVYVYNK